MLLHPGKTIEKGRRRKRAFSPGFFFVFRTPVGLPVVCAFSSFPNQHAERSLEGTVFLFAEWVQGESPCRGIQGARSPLLRPFLKQHAERSLEGTIFLFAEWVQGGSPCRRGTGGEEPPASSVPRTTRGHCLFDAIDFSQYGCRVDDPGAYARVKRYFTMGRSSP